MLNLDEDALICDFAETYHIYDYRSLPLKMAATLSAGLRDDSRIKQKLSGAPAGIDTILLATIADRVEAFRYGFSEDASKGVNRPLSLVGALYGEDQNKNRKNGVVGFETADEFMAALARIEGE